ncbi:MAG: IlvD/Edd family dehydratase [Gammaproteobacteria bacterium]
MRTLTCAAASGGSDTSSTDKGLANRRHTAARMVFVFVMLPHILSVIISKPVPPANRRKKAKPAAFRSARWFAPDDLVSFGHRARAKQLGWSDDDFGKPVIAIINTWSELNTCHGHFPERANDIKRGVWQAGGVPVELPAMSLGEQLMKPSAMMYRNFLAMETEELLRAYPVDGAVLMGGCDKTTPGVLMGAVSVNLPCVYMPAGAMMRGHFRAKTLGSGTDVWKYWDDKRAGLLPPGQWREIEFGIARTAGTCMTMGTAATMMIAAEALGFSLPGAASLPAVDAEHRRMARASGIRAVEITKAGYKPSDFVCADSFDNAIIAVMAAGGSTNAVIHLIALARRCGISLPLSRFEQLAAKTPVIADLKPSGRYVMEDLHRAGGILALLNRIAPLLHKTAKTVNGKTLAANIRGAKSYDDNVIRLLKNPLAESGGLRILRGSLAPDGCVIKPAAAEKRLHKHRGRAVVFDNIADLRRRINMPSLQVDADSVLVLKNAGPVGGPGMPEWGQLPIPQKLLKRGIRDMVRISDARMSGTSYGACVLHVAPEAAAGGAIGLVQNGDIISMDIAKGRLDLCVAKSELARRAKLGKAKKHANKSMQKPQSAYARLYAENVMQANEGCDFAFASRAFGESAEPYI